MRDYANVTPYTWQTSGDNFRQQNRTQKKQELRSRLETLPTQQVRIIIKIADKRGTHRDPLAKRTATTIDHFNALQIIVLEAYVMTNPQSSLLAGHFL